MAEFMNSASANPTFCRDAYTAVKLLASLSHAVLSLPELPVLDIGVHLSTLFEITRLSCLLLLAKLKEYFSHHASELHMLQHKLVALLGKSDLTWIYYLPDLALWSLVSAALVIDRRHMTCLATWINYAMYACGVVSARTAVQKAEHVIWIEVLERTSTMALVMEIDECSRTLFGTQESGIRLQYHEKQAKPTGKIRIPTPVLPSHLRPFPEKSTREYPAMIA